ncbi:MAG: sugar ABC transporter permease [Limnohabitans sp.]|nr:sugar ABC transporter permease [Limnohabitans sp.]
MVLPALIVLAVFFFVPVLAAFVLSFSDFDLYALADWHHLRWVGLSNYVDLLLRPLFWKALANTLYFVVLGVPLSIVVSLLAALSLNSPLLRFKGLWRTLMFAPVVTTLVAVAVVWKYFFHYEYGVVNQFTAWLGLAPIDWLGNPRWSMLTIVIFAAWKNFGVNMVILLAALQAIPEDLYEAARMDGAGLWRQFIHITIPMLAPSLLMVSVLTMAGYFQLCAEPFVMTQGGHLQSTVSVLYLMYDEGFKWWNLGQACAVAVVLFAIILVATQSLRRLAFAQESA